MDPCGAAIRGSSFARANAPGAALRLVLQRASAGTQPMNSEDENTRDRGRRLRARTTKEAELLKHLRAKRFDGLKFRRQQPRWSLFIARLRRRAKKDPLSARKSPSPRLSRDRAGEGQPARRSPP
jgi:uncharacterized protein DUF559